MSDSGKLYEQAQRRLVASLLYNSENANSVFEIATPETVVEPSLELIYTAMAELNRSNSPINAISVGKGLESTGNLEKAGGISELYLLRSEGERYSLESPIELYAKIVKDTSAKARITEILKESAENFKDDSGMTAIDGVSMLQSSLNESLIGLADESTVTEIKDQVEMYEELLETRRKITEENSGKADGLQGIPSMLPTLNEYTHGWGPSQMITCGARTGVGKALAIDTPILTTNGWTTMEEISVGDQVYGRDGKPTKVVNATEIQYGRKVYRIRFHNGDSIVADADHLWIVREHKDNIKSPVERTLTTSEILETLTFPNKGGHAVFNYSIGLTDALQNEQKDFDIEPFDFAKNIVKGSVSEDFKLVGENLDLVLKNRLEGYLGGSVEQREAFVKGIISEIEDDLPYIDFSDYEVANEIRAMFSSLGYLTFINFDEKENSFQLTFYDSETFTNGYDRHSLHIVDVQEIESVPVKCIEVDNADHTYLADKYLIPTHNSVFAVNSAVAAAQAGKSVLFFTLEMSNAEIDDRIIASISGVSMSKLKNGNITEEENEKVKDALDQLRKMKITVDSDPKVTVDTIRARATRQAQSPDGLDLIIVDYLQLITPVGRFSSRQEAVASISRNMKLLAKTMEVPIIVLVQLNRGKDDEEDKLPTIDNIRESGSIGMDSDIVILLHRDANFDDTTPHTLFLLEKNRNGENKKIIRCHSNLSTSLFREVRKEKDVAEERLSDEDLSELEDDLDLSEFGIDDEDLDFDDLD